MFVAVIAGYVLAASLAFCGVANLVAYIGDADRTSGYSVFLHGLAIELWPLAAAVVILLLIENASIAEKIHIYQKMLGGGESGVTPPPVQPKRKPAAKDEEDEGGYFRTHAVTPPAAQHAHRHDSKEKPSKVPETKRIEQVPEAPEAPHTEPAPRKPESSGLSYFKLD